MYHPDVAGAAGAAMTLRLNEAQRILLDPELRSRVDRPGSHSAGARQSATNTSQFTQGVPRTHEPLRTETAPTVVRQRQAVWEFLALSSITIIVASTVAVFAHTYPGMFGGLSARMIPPVVIALVWMAAGLSRVPRLAWVLLVMSMSLWPLATAGIWPITELVHTSPDWVWAALTASFISTIMLRVAAPRATRYRVRRTTTGRPYTA
jgi:hypothetical protein